MKQLTQCALVLLPFVICSTVSSASEPAVSSPNGKLGATVGNQGDSNISGSFTLGLTQSVGAQFDVSRAKHEDIGVASNSAAGHVFWRDPLIGLVGTAYSHHDGDAGNGHSFSLQGEKYFEQFTLRGHVGREYWNLGPLKGSDTLWRSTATWYSTPDLALHLRANRTLGRNWIGVGTEWQFAANQSTGYAFFFEAGKSRDLGTQVKGGFRIYLDSSKTLKSRHRTADPEAFDNNNTFNGGCPPGTSYFAGIGPLFGAVGGCAPDIKLPPGFNPNGN